MIAEEQRRYRVSETYLGVVNEIPDAPSARCWIAASAALWSVSSIGERPARTGSNGGCSL